MKNRLLFLVILLLFGGICLFSQKIESPKPTAIEDFVSNQDKSSNVLFSSTLVTYPFLELGFAVGAIDYNFKLKIESIVRLRIASDDNKLQFLLVSKEYDSEPIISYVTYFTIKANQVISVKIKKSDIIITNTEFGYTLDLSSLKNDSIAIIDVNYWFRPKSKEILVFYNNEGFNYSSLSINIVIPEIYIYNTSDINRCYSLKVTSGPEGGIVGYRSYSSPTGLISNSRMRDLKKVNPNESFQPVYYKTKSYLIELNRDCINVQNQTNSKIINFPLDQIIRMK